MQEICEQQSYAEPILNPLIGALFFNRPTTPHDITQTSGRFDTLLGELNRRLEPNGWLAGNKLSAADLNLYPLVQSVLEAHATEKAARLGLQPRSLGPLPQLVAWMEQLKPLASAEN